MAVVWCAGCSFQSAASQNPGGDHGGIDAQGVDAPAAIDAAPGSVCYGPAGWQVCFSSAPTGQITLPRSIDTDKSTDQGGLCLKAPPAAWGAPQPDACFIVGDTLSVPASLMPTVVTGKRPLVLVASSMISIAAVLDVASHRGDPAPALSSSDCAAFKQTPDDPKPTKGGSGGAGGSFRTQAGDGGLGDGAGKVGQASLASGIPTHLRGGCAGQEGGGGDPTEAGPGGGGRAIYLVSGGTIVITPAGGINASGAGAPGGKSQTGGSGGGSGGMIVLYGRTFTVDAAAVLVANGGAGSGGADSNPGQVGEPGEDPNPLTPLVPAKNIRNGGAGYAGTMAAADGTKGNSNGGGGGGGGGASGYIRSNQSLGALASPAVDVVP